MPRLPPLGTTQHYKQDTAAPSIAGPYYYWYLRVVNFLRWSLNTYMWFGFSSLDCLGGGAGRARGGLGAELGPYKSEKMYDGGSL